MDAGQFATLLANIRSADNAARSAAEKAYTELLANNANQAFALLAGCLPAGSGADEVLRTQACTMLRRATVQVGSTQVPWSRADSAVQSQVKIALLQALESEPSASIRKIQVAAITSVAVHMPENATSGSWPEVIPSAFTLASSANMLHKEAAMRLIAELINTGYKEALLERRQELGSLVSAGLTTPELQPASLSLVSEMMSVADTSLTQALQPALPMVENALKAVASRDQSAFEDALQAFIETASMQAAFFKPRLREWVEMMLIFARARGAIDGDKRSLAFEWVSTIAESKSKLLLKAVPDIVQRVLEVAFEFLSEVEEDDGWHDIDEDEEEDDAGSLHKSGEAKVDFFVKKFGFERTGKSLLALLQQYANSTRWEGKFAAAMAMRAAVEFVDGAAALYAMAAILQQLVNDPHMRVRYAALLALGQACHDQEADFHNRWHERLVPLLAQACSDPIDRCAAMAAGALEAVVADLEEEVLTVHAQMILQALVSKMTSSSHPGVLVAVMEAVGALAAGLEGSFGEFYDQLMTMLLAFVSKPPGEQRSAAKLRGKAFECISLLGYSVGKDKFAPAAQQTMAAMLATPTVADDVQTDCIRDAMERMCKIMGPDFAPFLPNLLPGLLGSMRMEQAVSATGEDEPDAENELTIPTEEGLMKVNTSQVQEMLAMVKLLAVLINQTGQKFLEFVQPTAEALNRILGCTDPVLNLASSVRDAVYPCWAELVKVVSAAVPTKGQEAQTIAIGLVQRFVDKVGADLTKAEDPEDIAAMGNGLANVVSSAGTGCLQPQQVQGISDLATSEILKSFQREKALEDGNLGDLAKALGGGEDDDDDDDDEAVGDVLGKSDEDEEKECRLGLSSIFGACMKINPEVFISHSWPALQGLMQEWLSPQGAKGKLLAVNLACDLCEHLGERSTAVWPVFMDAVLESVCAADAEERGSAAFCVVLAAQVPAFGPPYAARAFQALGASLHKFKAKKSDEDAQRAADNAVAALVQLCISHPSACPDLNGCWQTAFSKMPFKVDVEEGLKLHRKLFAEAQKPNGGNLGSMERVAQVLGYLCEIYDRSEHCDEDLQKEMAKTLRMMQPDTRQALVARFTAKQQKKVERILADAQK